MGRHEGAAVNSRDMERDWLGLRSAGPEGTPARGEGRRPEGRWEGEL